MARLFLPANGVRCVVTAREADRKVGGGDEVDGTGSAVVEGDGTSGGDHVVGADSAREDDGGAGGVCAGGACGAGCLGTAWNSVLGRREK